MPIFGVDKKFTACRIAMANNNNTAAEISSSIGGSGVASVTLVPSQRFKNSLNGYRRRFPLLSGVFRRLLVKSEIVSFDTNEGDISDPNIKVMEERPLWWPAAGINEKTKAVKSSMHKASIQYSMWYTTTFMSRKGESCWPTKTGDQ